MILACDTRTPYAEQAAAIATRFEAGADYVYAQSIIDVNDEPQNRKDRIRQISQAIGQLARTNDLPESELWLLDSSSSPDHGAIKFHTDNPYFLQPERIVGFWSLATKRLGGENVILPVTRLLEWLECKQQRDLADELTESEVAFRLGRQAASGPIIEQKTKHIRFDLRYMDAEGVVLGTRLLRALDDNELPVDKVLLLTGDALFFNNRTNLHARTAHNDPDRSIIRVRLNLGI